MFNFIHVWKNKISDHICDDIIQSFEKNLSTNPQKFVDGKNHFFNSNIGRNDLSFVFDSDTSQASNKICNAIYDGLWECYFEYKREYGQLQHCEHICSNLKVQRTLPYGGYHAWHYEQGDNLEVVSRELVWTIYLNTMPPNEAETEFLYQAVKLRPEKGSLCIFPAAMTHVHRGLTVYSHPKYIITGWFTKVLKKEQEINQNQLQFQF